MIRLPNAPSALIRLALADLHKVEEDDRYEVDMEEWHWPNSRDGRCHVCLAGAVMAGTLEVPPEDHILPASFALDGTKLRALNSLRLGYVHHALEHLFGRKPIPDGVPERMDVPQYRHDPVGFYREMRVMADILEEAGL
jgi:hypothetical protein